MEDQCLFDNFFDRLFVAGESYFDRAEEAEYKGNYIKAIEYFVIARAFYEKYEHLEAIRDCDRNISELLINLGRDLDERYRINKLGPDTVADFLKTDKKRRKILGLVGEFPDPVFSEIWG